MSSKRAQSSQNLRVRAQSPSDQQSTLRPCPACDGSGTRERRNSVYSYSHVRCRWCEGMGLVDNIMYDTFVRWLRIYHHHRIRGLCPK